MNHLYYGDTLQILRERIKTSRLTLLTPTLPSIHRVTTTFFKAPPGEQSPAQIGAFEDTCHWNATAEQAFDEVMKSGNSHVAETLGHVAEYDCGEET